MFMIPEISHIYQKSTSSAYRIEYTFGDDSAKECLQIEFAIKVYMIDHLSEKISSHSFKLLVVEPGSPCRVQRAYQLLEIESLLDDIPWDVMLYFHHVGRHQ